MSMSCQMSSRPRRRPYFMGQCQTAHLNMNVQCYRCKVNKERLNVMVYANMTGTEKLSFLVLGKSKAPWSFKNVKSLPVAYQANMDDQWDIHWVDPKTGQQNVQPGMKNCPSCRQLCCSKRHTITLVVDNCAAQKDIANLKAVTLMFLPRARLAKHSLWTKVSSKPLKSTTRNRS